MKFVVALMLAMSICFGVAFGALLAGCSSDVLPPAAPAPLQMRVQCGIPLSNNVAALVTAPELSEMH